VISIGEIERGIAQQRAADPGFAESLAAWLDRVLALYGERVLAIDLQTARRWSILSAAHGNPAAGLMIAATALEHGLKVEAIESQIRRGDAPGPRPRAEVAQRGFRQLSQNQMLHRGNRQILRKASGHGSSQRRRGGRLPDQGGGCRQWQSTCHRRRTMRIWADRA